LAIENATTISGLNETLPTDSDPGSEGPAHIRLIKSILKSVLPDDTSTKLANPMDYLPIGTTMVWFTRIGAVPTYWVEANGQTEFEFGDGQVHYIPDLLGSYGGDYIWIIKTHNPE